MKMMHEYKAVQVPASAKEMVDKIFIEMKKKNKRIRKADIWLDAVEKYVEFKIKTDI